jgi:N-acetylglucosaminyldiphosphoundecaprenol N-acetyl-beta-D-mannosaminyltransferase
MGKESTMSVGLRPPLAVDVLGLPVHPLSLPEALERLGEAVRGREPATVISLNGALLRRALRDPEVAAAVRDATLVIPDGVGVLVAAWILGIPPIRRLAGVDLADAVCTAAAARGWRIFLLGAAPGVAEAAAARLRERYPALQIIGTAHGFYAPDDEPALLERIRQSGAEVLLVAFGAPRQELWLRAHSAALGVPVLMGVGGTLDVLAGRTRRAPRWVQRVGLEWFYRLAREPWRWGVVRTIPPLFLIALRERIRRVLGERGDTTVEGR